MATYQVIVGNVGIVYQAGNGRKARSTFCEYVRLSKGGGSRCAGEPVHLTKDGEPIRDYFPVTDAERIRAWCALNPCASARLAASIIVGLMCDYDTGALIGEDDDFPSGADFIESVVEKVDGTDLGKLIKKLKKQ